MNELTQGALATLYQLIRGRPIEMSSAYSPEKLTIITAQIISNVTVLIILGVIVFFVYRYKRRWLARAILAVTVIDLFLFSRGNIITIPFSAIQTQNPVVSWIKTHSDFDRFLSTSGNLPYTGLGVYWTHLRAREPFSPNQLTSEELTTFARFKEELASLPENQGMKARIFDASGYAAAIPKESLAFWSSSPSSPNAPLIHDFTSRNLDIVGVKYVVTGYPDDYLAFVTGEKFSLANEVGGIKVYENSQAWPRAFLLEDDLRIPALITSYEPTKILIKVEAQKDGSLVLTDTYYPGWIAKVDGKRVPIGRFYDAFRQVPIPPGKHTVEFLYKPTSVRLGAIISLTAFSGTSIFLWQKKRKSRSSS